MSFVRRFAPPQLPLFTRIVLPIDMVLCLIRVISTAYMLSQFERELAKGPSMLWLPIAANALIVGNAWLGGTMLLMQRKFGVAMYWIATAISFAVWTLSVVAMTYAPVPGMNHSTMLVGMALTVFVVLTWFLVLAEGLNRASRWFRFRDKPQEADRLDLAYLASYPGLRELSLAGNPLLGSTDCMLLGKLTELERLDLERTSIDDHGVSHLAALPKLRYLNLDATKVTARVLAALDRMSALEEVSLEWTACPREEWAGYARKRWQRELPPERVRLVVSEPDVPERIRRPM